MAARSVNLLTVLSLTARLRELVAQTPPPREAEFGGRIYAVAETKDILRLPALRPLLAVQYTETIVEQARSLSTLQQFARDRYMIAIVASRKAEDTAGAGGDVAALCQAIRNYLLFILTACKFTDRYEPAQLAGVVPLFAEDDELMGLGLSLDLPWWLSEDDSQGAAGVALESVRLTDGDDRAAVNVEI